MPSNLPEYDLFADIYDLWASVDPAYEASHTFYLNLCQQSSGKIVELGVGTGRIAVDIAKAGRNITGIDISSSMLEICRQRAVAAGVQNRIELIQGDLQSFHLTSPVDLIIIPFRSLGHVLTLENKKKALKNIFLNLVPGGQVVFDHYLFHEEWARNHDGFQRLMFASSNPGKENLFIWDTYQYSFSIQQITGVITVEKTNPRGQVEVRSHYPIHESWIYPDQVRHLAAWVGFEVEAVYGDFSCHELTDTSSDQVWVFRHPLQ